MNFVSMKYVLFLMIVFGAYWNVSAKHRWKVLLVSSAIFYMSWNVAYIILLLFVALLSYTFAILIEDNVYESRRRGYLFVFVIVDILVLFVFKYLNFSIGIVNDVMKVIKHTGGFDTFDIILPVGISFYIFQSIAYIVDVYRKGVKAERSIGLYLTYIMFFPQLVAGPIERSKNLLPQIKKKDDFDYDLAVAGMKILLWGYFKKAVIADNLAIYVDAVYSDVVGYTGFSFAIAAFFFTLQIYCDFSGYTDIAKGTANLFGIRLMDNFSFPYSSCSMKEFWSRWHISLNAWFRDYVYIPLGGSRCSAIKRKLNIIIIFILSGLWHGAAWNFLVWGGTTD